MDSADHDHQRELGFRWADLPLELIAIIFSYLPNPTDLIRFRSVCRSWRFSTSPPPNILSPFFPLKLSTSLTRFSPHQPQSNSTTLYSTAVYLLRPRNDPNSKPWMVSVHESAVGKLFLHHALTYEEIAGPCGEKSLDLSSEKWSATQISRSYCHNSICRNCKRYSTSEKVAFVSNSDSNRKTGASGSASGSGARSQLVGLCKSGTLRFVFVLGSTGKANTRNFVLHRRDENMDFVYFNGWIYGVDINGYLYVFDDKKLEWLQINYRDLHSSLKNAQSSSKKYLVVSDGDLYLVLRCYSFRASKTRIYRLVLMEEGNVMIPRCKWEEVESLRDRVFFFREDCAFSVSARDLPDPWKGNCVVFVHGISCGCVGRDPGIEVLHLGGDQKQQVVPMSSLPGYSDLFAWI